jgi:hypothetical protein
MKVMVSKDGTIYGKMWPEGDQEPDEWSTEAALASHMDEDGVGLTSYSCITYFDDIIVAAAEDSLVMAVSPRKKLTVTWGVLKSNAE